MFVTIPNTGTTGDVQPAIALGLGLEKAGYRVKLMAFDEYQALITSYGLGFYHLRVNMQVRFEKHGGANLNAVKIITQVKGHALDVQARV